MRVVFCVGGLLDGQSFTEDDWRERVTAAQNIAEKGQTATPALGYRKGKMADLTRRLPAVLTEHTVLVMTWSGP